MGRLLNDESNLQPELLKALLDADTRKAYASFSAFLTHEHPDIDQSTLPDYVAQVEAAIMEQVTWFSHLVYARMQRSGNWTDAGEQQVKVAFCRNILDLPASEQLTYEHATQFEARCHEAQKRYGFDKLSQDELDRAFEDFSFTLFGTTFDIHDISMLHHALAFLESKNFLQGGYYGHDRELIFGTGTLEKRDEYDVVQLTKEFIRTPNTVMCMVAVIGEKQIFVRREALESMFYQKWIPHARYPYPIHQKPAYVISEAIKASALRGYEAADEETLLAQKEAFIEDMGENILQHELGHGIIQHHVLPQDVGAVAEATKMCGETICVALLEILAEMAPLHGELWGPLANMVKHADTDYLHAERQFWVYLSDAWFFDTEDEHLFLYSELMSLIMARFVSNKTVDFDALRTELTWRENYTECPAEDQTLLEWALTAVHRLVAQLKDIAAEATYTVEEKRYTLDEFKAMTTQKFHDELQDVDESSYAFDTALWSEIFDVLNTASTHQEAFQACLKQFEGRCLQELMEKVTTQTGETPLDSPRHTIYSMLSRGLDVSED